MATKTITITEEAYGYLKSRKKESESFSNVIVRLANKRSILDFAGAISDREADELSKRVIESRRRSRRRK